MTTLSRRIAGPLAIGLLSFSMPALAVSCLLFPLSCLKPKKKYGEETEALVLDLRSTRTDAYEVRVNTGGGVYDGPMVVANPMQNKRAWYIWFKVGETLYQAERDETVLQMAYKKPQRADWVGKTVPMRFLDKKWMGMKGAQVVFKRDKGKEWDFVLVSIIGPDGIDECAGRVFCPQQAEVDRDAREEEQLAKLGKSGAKSASDVAPMAVDLPELPDAEGSGAMAAAPDSAATPAESPVAAPEPVPAEPADPFEAPDSAEEPAVAPPEEEPPTDAPAPVAVAVAEAPPAAA